MAQWFDDHVQLQYARGSMSSASVLLASHKMQAFTSELPMLIDERNRELSM